MQISEKSETQLESQEAGCSIRPPEEHPHSGTAGGSVGRARSYVFPVQLSETAGAL